MKPCGLRRICLAMEFLRPSRTAALSLSALVFSACAGGALQPPSAQTPRAVLAPRDVSDAAKDPWLYVTGNHSNNVVIYDLGRRGFPKIAEITNGVSGPNGVAVDAGGQVYVANSTGSVSIYDSGATTPKLTLTQGLTVPESVAVDANGSVYVCNRGTGGSIVVFPKGENTPSKVITNRLIEVPSQIQFDGSGNLFYADGLTGVSEIPSHSMQMHSLNLRKLQLTEGLALDPTDGNLFVGTLGGQLNGVRVYPHNQQSPVRTLKNSGSGNLYTTAKVDGTEYIFIPDRRNNTVRMFTSNGNVPFRTVTAVGLSFAFGVAVKPAGVP